MIHVAISLPDDVGAVLEVRAREEGFADLADYVRALAEAEADGERGWQVTPELEAALEEGERSGYVPYNFEEIIAEARAEYLSN